MIQTEDYNLRFVDKAVFAGLTQVWSLHCVMVFLAHLAEIFIKAGQMLSVCLSVCLDVK